ncbi:hypothetical protein D3C78_1342860 [compost metagenome]
MANSATEASFGRDSSMAMIRARSPGWVICAAGRSDRTAAMSVATNPGQTAVARTPLSKPACRTACERATAANLDKE